MTPNKFNFVVVVNVLMPICCHIGSGMTNLQIFVEDIVLGAMTDKWLHGNLSGVRIKTYKQ